MKNLIKKIAAAVTAVCVLCMIPLTSYAASEAAIASTEGRTRTRQDAEDLLRDMNDSTIHITIEQRGIFVEMTMEASYLDHGKCFLKIITSRPEMTGTVLSAELMYVLLTA